VAPTLLITAHYDCFSPAPAAPACADSTGSGAATALLLLRMLHRMFASAESRPSRNVLVVLTAGGPYGQEGLRQWLADADPEQVEAIEAAIVLDSIGASTVMQQQAAAALGRGDDDDGVIRQRQQLHAHLASGGSSEQWLKALQVAAERVGVSLAPVVKELPADSAAGAAGAQASTAGGDAAEPAAAGAAGFGHEHLARRGLAAVTLSGVAAAPVAVLSNRVRACSVGDVAAGVNLDAVLSAAQVAADATSRWLYPEVDPELRLLDLSADADTHKDFLQGWVGLLAEMHAMMPFTQVSNGGQQRHAAAAAAAASAGGSTPWPVPPPLALLLCNDIVERGISRQLRRD